MIECLLKRGVCLSQMFVVVQLHGELFFFLCGIFFLKCFQLYNVVVDTEVTGKKLISNGKLKRRYTFIPLNKIAARTLSDDVVKRAEGLVSRL